MSTTSLYISIIAVVITSWSSLFSLLLLAVIMHKDKHTPMFMYFVFLFNISLNAIVIAILILHYMSAG